MTNQSTDMLSLLIEMDEALKSGEDGFTIPSAKFVADWSARVYPHRLKDIDEALEQAEIMNQNLFRYGTIDAPKVKYRQLRDGDIVGPEDEFLENDAETWTINSERSSWLGAVFSSGFHMPMRRRIKKATRETQNN